MEGPPNGIRREAVSSHEEVKRRARAQFGPAADRYVSDPIHVEGDELSRMIELARLTGAERVLDVATGGGHTALAFAAHVQKVVALDLTPAMLAAAARFIGERGVDNGGFQVGDGEGLPVSDGGFDVGAAGLRPRHFPRPGRFLGR